MHEIKHDGFRLMVRREGARVRLWTRGGCDWADRFPAIVEAASAIKTRSFLIDGEAVICRDDGLSDFNALRSRRHDHEVTLIAFDLIEWQGDDLRDQKLIDRKNRLPKIPARGGMRAGWALKASCPSGSTRGTGPDRQRFGSSRKTQRARPCGARLRLELIFRLSLEGFKSNRC